ncbi:MAG: dTDP-glucose pyrophosphorylase [Acidobacteria bacterium]|nr:MAG: dTDP-glucose pyrophosphorylase [Acidobacteriota bacterium]
MSRSSDNDQHDPVVALIPAAGRATRLRGLSCSKEIYPVGTSRPKEGGPPRPKAVCEYLLEALVTAGIHRGFVVLRPGKEDIPAHLDGLDLDIEITYLTIEDSPSVAHTLDHAHPLLAGMRVALGFPDIVFQPQDAFRQILERQQTTRAPLVLGLFPTDQGPRSDMVELDNGGRARRIVIKQPGTDLRFMWSIAVWTPRFTDYLHRFLESPPPTREDKRGLGRELFIGDVVQTAIEDGFEVETVVFDQGQILDVGTPESLRLAASLLADRSHPQR